MAGTARSFLDGSGDPQNRSVTNVGGLDLNRTIAVDETDTPIAPATSALQTAGNTKLDTLHTDLTALAGFVDGLEGFTDGIEGALATLNAKDFATQTTLAAILAKIIAAPATEATVASIATALAATLRTFAPASATATPSNVPGATSSTLLLAANANRLGGSIVNDSTAILYILLGAGSASTTNYSYVLDGKATVGGTFEIPEGWTGAIQGIWASATGNARVTERTA